jgi:hypothetical protein
LLDRAINKRANDPMKTSGDTIRKTSLNDLWDAVLSEDAPIKTLSFL